jgi:hypothetical protein
MQEVGQAGTVEGELYMTPEEDEECKRGIPVFKPTMEVRLRPIRGCSAATC